MFAKLFGKKPVAFDIQLTPSEIQIRSEANETLLQSALKQGLAFPHNCRAGGCGACKCRLVKGKVKELTDKSYILSAEELQRNFILACQSVPKSDIQVDIDLETPAAGFGSQHRVGRIVAMEPLTHDIIHLILRLEHALAFIPGQYCSLMAQRGSAADIPRSYSFANIPGADGKTDTLEFFIRKVPGGHFTEWLFNEASIGEVLNVNGPFGDFMLREDKQPLLIVAGGSGLAPIRAMLQQALQTHLAPREVTLMFGARTQQDLYMLDEIRQLQRTWITQFTFIPVLSHEPADSPWTGLKGLIADHFAKVLGNTIHQHQAYLCGPPGMIDSCIARLKAGGMSDSVIHFDRFLDASHSVPKAIANG